MSKQTPLDACLAQVGNSQSHTALWMRSLVARLRGQGWSPRSGLNRQHPHYKCGALPLSYAGAVRNSGNLHNRSPSGKPRASTATAPEPVLSSCSTARILAEGHAYWPARRGTCRLPGGAIMKRMASCCGGTRGHEGHRGTRVRLKYYTLGCTRLVGMIESGSCPDR